MKHRAERLDYFPTRQDAAPLLVFIHGGYWRSLDKSDFSWLAPPFVQHGVALALPNYGLAPATPIEDIVRQQLKALAWLYRNGDRLGFDPERIVVVGHSAGAHLTAMMMAALWPIYAADLPRDAGQGRVWRSAASTTSNRWCTRPSSTSTCSSTQQRARALSPIHLPPATSAPLITAVAPLESSEFQRQTALIGRAWKPVSCAQRPDARLQSPDGVDELANPASPLFDRRTGTGAQHAGAAAEAVDPLI